MVDVRLLLLLLLEKVYLNNHKIDEPEFLHVEIGSVTLSRGLELGDEEKFKGDSKAG